MLMKPFFLLVFIWSTTLLALNKPSTPIISDNTVVVSQELGKQKMIRGYEKKLAHLEQEISAENSWLKSYASYLTSVKVRTNLSAIKKRINYLHKHAKSITDKDELNGLISKETILTSQVEKLKGKGGAPFSELITPPVIEKVGKITNPFDVFTGFSVIKTQRQCKSIHRVIRQ